MDFEIEPLHFKKIKTRIPCCFSLFSKHLAKNASLGLVKKYKTEELFKFGLKMIVAMAFVPDCDVIMVERLMDYF
jgi:hypothetical protein